MSTYGNEIANKETLIQQDEIVFDAQTYKAPDINFLTKPELSRDNSVNHEELKINAEKLKSVLTDFKIEVKLLQFHLAQ